MSFGYSVGDFIAGANLSYRLIRALLGTKGAFVEYQEAIEELGSMQQAFFQVSQLHPSYTLSLATVNAASHIVLSSVKLIGDFLARTEKYRERLCTRASGGAISESWQKVGWSLFGKEEMRDLRDELHVKLSNLSVLLATAQIHGAIPASIAQYGVDQFSVSDSSVNNSHLEATKKEIKADARAVVAEVEAERQESIKRVKRATEGAVAEAIRTRDDLSVVGDPEMKKKMLAIEEKIKALSIEFEKAPMEIAAWDAAEAAAKRAAEARAEAEIKAKEEKEAWEKKLDEYKKAAQRLGAENERKQIEADRKKAEQKAAEEKEWADAKATVEKAEADAKAAISKVETERKEAIEKAEKEAKEAVAKAVKEAQEAVDKALAPRDDIKKPIKFKDAIGRRFSFPFHLCATWVGMEELIGQAFFYNDVIGPLVAEGHYDLINPNGEIILPQVWETMIEPDWAISMHMWPMPEPEAKHGGQRPVVPQLTLPPSIKRLGEWRLGMENRSPEPGPGTLYDTGSDATPLISAASLTSLSRPKSEEEHLEEGQQEQLKIWPRHKSQSSISSELSSQNTGSSSSTIVKPESCGREIEKLRMNEISSEDEATEKEPKATKKNSRRPRRHRPRRRRPKSVLLGENKV